MVADNEDHAIALENETPNRIQENGVIVQDHSHLEVGLVLFGGEAAPALEPADAMIRPLLELFVRRKPHHRIKVENVAVEDQLRGPLNTRLHVLEKCLEAGVDEMAAALEALPQRIMRMRWLRIGQMDVAHDESVLSLGEVRVHSALP